MSHDMISAASSDKYWWEGSVWSLFQYLLPSYLSFLLEWTRKCTVIPVRQYILDTVITFNSYNFVSFILMGWDLYYVLLLRNVQSTVDLNSATFTEHWCIILALYFILGAASTRNNWRFKRYRTNIFCYCYQTFQEHIGSHIVFTAYL